VGLQVDTFVHNASAVNTVCCSLDGVPVPYCSLPYSTPRLVPGVHTFNATYLDPSTQVRAPQAVSGPLALSTDWAFTVVPTAVPRLAVTHRRRAHRRWVRR
jgi:hypothetical protein